VGSVVALVVGALVGVFNWAVVAYTRIPSFVVTLGMLAMASGLALGITQGQTISGFPQGLLAIGAARRSSSSRSRPLSRRARRSSRRPG
jgi:ribose/xylose/arabinose/galactoside ABC-type transport system permease subunit